MHVLFLSLLFASAASAGEFGMCLKDTWKSPCEVRSLGTVEEPQGFEIVVRIPLEDFKSYHGPLEIQYNGAHRYHLRRYLFGSQELFFVPMNPSPVEYLSMHGQFAVISQGDALKFARD